MAEQEKKEQIPYQFTPEGGQPTNSSADYTGRGTAKYPNGDSYEGDFAKGVRTGKGKYTYSNGDVYNGDVQNNLKHGIGRLVYADKSEYHGEWRNGKKSGEGMLVYPNRDIYSGKWANGCKHGEGTYVFNATGMKFVGCWTENRFIKGRWTYPNGSYFEGDFQNCKPKGAGRWVLSNGNVIEGEYEQMIVPTETNQLQTQLSWTQA